MSEIVSPDPNDIRSKDSIDSGSDGKDGPVEVSSTKKTAC